MKKPLVSVLLYSVGLVLTKGASLLVLPFLAHTLTISEIGRLEFLASITAFWGLVSGLAMHEALYRFTSAERHHSNRKRLAEQLVCLTWVVSLVFIPVVIFTLYLLSQMIESVSTNELIMVAFGIFLSAPLTCGMAWFRIEDKVKEFLILSIGGCIIQVLLIITFMRLEMGVMGVLLSATGTHLLQLGVFQFLAKFSIRLPSVEKIRQALKYCVPIAMSSVVAFGLNGAEKWLITLTSSLETLAAYAISAKLALAMCILVQPFNMWWMGKRFEYLKHKGLNETAKLTQLGLIWIFVLASSLLFIGPLLISFGLPPEYSSAVSYLVFPLTSALMKELSELVNIGLLAKKQSVKLLYINIQSVIIGAIAALCLWRFEIWGVLSAVLVAQFYKLVVVYVTSQKLHHLPYQYLALTLIAISYLALVWVSLILTSTHQRLSLAILAPLFITLIAYRARLMPSEWALMSSKPPTKPKAYSHD
jgi:O-antigen/teichoic acid export membrane protein